MKVYETIKLNKEEGGTHLYIQLYRALKDLMGKGKLKKGDRLPPIRKMATLLGVNTVTVVSAYRILEEEGLVYKRVGSGTYISYSPQEDIEVSMGEEVPSTTTPSSLMEQGHIHIQDSTINFASATPSTDLFPVEDFKEVLNEILERDKGAAFGYQEGQGYYPLRLALKEYMHNYGIDTRINNIQIISGAQQGIDIIAKSLVDYGDYVMIEGPSYTGAMAVFQSRGAKIIDIPLEEDGLDLEILEKKIRTYKPKLLYLMPNFQNPTGVSYSIEKKKKIIAMAKKYNLLIVEDDYLSELNFYSENNATLKSLDEDDLVIYIKSFSKIFMPGLRLGFLVAPESLYGDFLMAKHSTDISTSGLLQRALQLYLEKGIWRQHIKYMEDQYKERFEEMVSSLGAYMPKSITYNLPKGGVHFWLKLPSGFTTKVLYDKAIKENIAIAPGNLFFLDNSNTPYFRLSIAAVDKEKIHYGIKKLGAIIEAYLYKKDEDYNREGEYTPIL